MKRFFTLIISLVLVMSVNAQIAPNKYWVQFTDKNGSPYSIDNPEAFLSERAIQRRVDYGIAIDEYDIPVNPSYLQAVSDAGAELLNPSKWLNGVTVFTADPSVIDAISDLPFVSSTRALNDDPLKQMIKEKTFFSNESLKPIAENKLGGKDYYGYANVQINQLNGIALHDLGYKGQGMLIGVCDGGYQGADTHPVFDSVRDSGRLLGTRDFVTKNGNVYTDSSHGTSCWSLMAGNVPNTYVGTAPMASYFLCKTEESGSENIIEEYNWVSAAELLDSIGADVISTSLGYITFDLPQWDHVYEDLDGETCIITIGSEIACSRGIMCVTSAGNEGGNSFPYISAPADGEQVFTIGAVGSNGQRAYFSSVGPTYDGRIKPDVMAHGYGTFVASTGGSYYDGSGTSFSCPVLAGMITCLWQANKDKTADVIRESVRRSGNYASNPDNEYGYGIPDFMQALDFLGEEENTIVEQNAIISAYPNPSMGMVNINLNVEENVTVQVFDQLGKLLYVNDLRQDNVSELNTFMSNLQQGMYLIYAQSNGITQTLKCVKY